MVLEAELKYYEEQKQELLAHHEGQFALIKGDQLVGVFSTEDEAFNVGVAKLGNVPFLIQSVQVNEEFIQQPALAVGMISAHS